MTIMFAALGESETTSPLRTRADGMSTRLPLMWISPWFTNWRACGRVDAQPAEDSLGGPGDQRLRLRLGQAGFGSAVRLGGWYSLALAIVVLDQLTKGLAELPADIWRRGQQVP